MSSEPRGGASSQLHVTGWNVSASVIHPLFNMSVGPMEVLLTVDLPYVDQKDIKLRCPTTESLEVYAETSRKITFRDLGVKHRHGEFTCYQALIQFPYQVDEKKIVSKFKRGILEVRLPRRK